MTSINDTVNYQYVIGDKMPKVIIDLAEFYSTEEASQLLKKGIATIWRHIKSGKIHALRIGGRTLIPKSELQRIRNEQALNR